MKIEKVNDHQIRCTLTKEDLANRDLRISELAYGSEKARDLFKDMMQQASAEFGFEAEDIPLMIEAVPLNGECIVLIVTKVDDPEELDTRFSRFSPSATEELDQKEEPQELSVPEEILDLTKRVHELADKVEKFATAQKSEKETPISRMYSFSSMQEIYGLASILGATPDLENTLYKNEENGKYLLYLSSEGMSDDSFGRVCNVLTEYGYASAAKRIDITFVEEHYSVLIRSRALQKLALLA